MKPLNGDDVPDGVVTATVRSPTWALAAIDIMIGREVEVPPVPMVAVTPDPLNVTAVAPLRFVPVIVAPRVAPGAPEFGPSDVIRGAGEPGTTKFAVVAVPPGVVTAIGPVVAPTGTAALMSVDWLKIVTSSTLIFRTA